TIEAGRHYPGTARHLAQTETAETTAAVHQFERGVHQCLTGLQLLFGAWSHRGIGVEWGAGHSSKKGPTDASGGPSASSRLGSGDQRMPSWRSAAGVNSLEGALKLYS